MTKFQKYLECGKLVDSCVRCVLRRMQSEQIDPANSFAVLCDFQDCAPRVRNPKLIQVWPFSYLSCKLQGKAVTYVD